MDEISQRVLEALESVDVDQWVLELGDYTRWLVLSYTWRRGYKNTGQLAEGKDIEDIVQEAFTKVLTGDHRWPDDHTDLFSFLKDVVKRLVSNLSRSADNQTRELPKDYDLSPTIVHDEISPAEEDVLNRILALADVRSDVRAIVQAFLDGGASYKDDLPVVSGMEHKEVYNALRHIRRYILPPPGTKFAKKNSHD